LVICKWLLWKALKRDNPFQKEKFFKILLSVIGGLLFLSVFIVVLEVYLHKELIPFLSTGDCRIVNTSKAFELKDASIIVHKTKAGTTHVVAIDSDKIVHDLSKGGEKNNGISYTQYKANNFDKNIYTAVLKNENIVANRMMYDSLIETYLYKFYVYVSIFAIKIKGQ